jgi:uncharacterized protein YjdB
VAAGTAKITVTTVDGGKTAVCAVTVYAPGRGCTTPVSGVSLNTGTLNLTVNGTAALTATVAPAGTTNKAVSWVSDNKAVVTVEGGSVKAISAGTAKITVTTVDGGHTATCELTVYAPGGDRTPVSKVDLNKETLDLTVNGTETLTAMITPGSATNTAVS